jgi:hypothetical protein
MRISAAVILSFWIACLCSGQIPAPAIPADPFELVTGNGKAIAKVTDRTPALALLNKAKEPVRLLNPSTPPYLLTASFTAVGDPANSGAGEFTELWLGARNWRFTAKLGDFSVNRIATQNGPFDEKPVPILPMRVHMLRNSIFWAAQGLTANSQFRSAPVKWNGRPATCLLVSDQPDTGQTQARRWDESEYCIDDQSGLVQILSVAPGNYTVYTYAAGHSFQGRPMPDRIKTYTAGIAVIDASVRMSEPTAADRATVAVTAEMMAGGQPVGLDEPMFRRVNVKAAAEASVMVNAQIGPDGKVVVQELCAASDASLAPRALDRVKGMEFGRSGVQRQAYVEVRFGPAASASAIRTMPSVSSVPTVPVEPYYMERTIADPADPVGMKEVHARRSDGATVVVSTVARSDQHTRNLRFADGGSVTVYDTVKAKVTWPAPNEVEKNMLRSRALSSPSDCGASAGFGTLLRREEMEGQDVAVIQRTDGSRRATFWAAPKLGCQYLYVDTEVMQSNGSFRKSAQTKTTRLVVGEPDPQLFEIAPDFVEMKPSEAQRRVWESMDLGLSPEKKAAVMRDLQREGAEMDKQYEGKKP